MPHDLTLKAMNALHRVWIAFARGRGGWDAARMPVVELTTTGRRTGRTHRVLLTSPIQVGDAYVVVASRGGDDRPPAWLLNLRAEPRVQVRLHGGPPQPAVARVATAAERADLWPRTVAAYPGYAHYQARTTREIALVLLEAPDGGSSGADGGSGGADDGSSGADGGSGGTDGRSGGADGGSGGAAGGTGGGDAPG